MNVTALHPLARRCGVAVSVLVLADVAPTSTPAAASAAVRGLVGPAAWAAAMRAPAGTIERDLVLARAIPAGRLPHARAASVDATIAKLAAGDPATVAGVSAAMRRIGAAPSRRPASRTSSRPTRPRFTARDLDMIRRAGLRPEDVAAQIACTSNR